MKNSLTVFFCFIFLVFPGKINAQSSFLNRNMDYYFQLERLDILNGRISDTLHTGFKGVTRKDAVYFLENYLEENKGTVTASEREVMADIISKNGEWAGSGDGAIESEYSLFKTIYNKKPDFIHYSSDKVYFVLNPVIHYQQTFESDHLNQNMFFNSKGVEARGLLAKRVGFYTIFTDNQERGPQHHQDFVLANKAVPGISFFKPFKPLKTGYAQDYLYAAGSVDAEVIKNIFNVTFGTDRFHIGDGYRSLFLTDFGSNYTFLKLNTRFWKLTYQNLFMELTPQYKKGSDALLSRKYATSHHLSINLTKWLNVGLFESVIFGRKDHFDFKYMNPIIFYRSVEQTNGSPDNALLGMNFKINTGVGALFYGQVLLDEFKFSQITANNGWWGNKYGLQLGMKIADPFKIKNLLIQAEVNLVRPYTYSFRDSIADYSHYNLPLAHPYGANFLEANLVVNYRPIKRTYISLKTFYNRQGRDTLSSVSFGGNVFKGYQNRNADQGISMFHGYVSQVLYGNLNLAYEIRDNLYFDFGGTYRNERGSHPANPSAQSFMVYTGLRLNSLRKQYDY